MFLDSVRTLRFPKIRNIYTRLQEKQKQQGTGTPEISSLPIPFIVHNFSFLSSIVRLEDNRFRVIGSFSLYIFPTPYTVHLFDSATHAEAVFRERPHCDGNRVPGIGHGIH